MAKSPFDTPQFKTVEAAYAYIEAALWSNGPVRLSEKLRGLRELRSKVIHKRTNMV